VTCIILVLS